MNPLQRLFPVDHIVVADGGWGAELLARGLALGESADLWNLSRPDVVEAVARSFVEAGAEVLLTNTFQANAIALGRVGMADEVVAVNRRGVEISRSAAATAVDRTVHVFGSIGPVGLGRNDKVDVAEAFAAGPGARRCGRRGARLRDVRRSRRGRPGSRRRPPDRPADRRLVPFRRPDRLAPDPLRRDP